MTRQRIPSLLILLALLPIGFANAQVQLRPTFASEVLAPTDESLLPLLKAACGEGVRTVSPEGKKAIGCGDGSMDEILASRSRPRKYAWMPYVLWQADGIIFGHFLSPTSDDVAINCFACENHPSLWGGTLLLTKKSGEWVPVWYKAGVITRHCRRISLTTGRQILFCEETDGGMGHFEHVLYLVDFKTPKWVFDSAILQTDSYGSTLDGGVQTQSIEQVSFNLTKPGGLLVRVYARHGSLKLRPDFEGQYLPRPKISNYEIDFRLDGDTLKITPQTAGAAKLFGTAR